jgi:hypothetical protein
VSKVGNPEPNANGDKSDHFPLTWRRIRRDDGEVRRLKKKPRAPAETLAGAVAWIAFQSQPEYVAAQIRKKLEGENHAVYRLGFSKPTPGLADVNLDNF